MTTSNPAPGTLEYLRELATKREEANQKAVMSEKRPRPGETKHESRRCPRSSRRIHTVLAERANRPPFDIFVE